MIIRTGCLALAFVCAAATAQAQSNGANTAAGAIIGGTAGALIGGAVTGNSGGAVAGAVIGGTTGAIIGSQAGQGDPYYFWGQDGRCYLHKTSGSIVRVSRGYCR